MKVISLKNLGGGENKKGIEAVQPQPLCSWVVSPWLLSGQFGFDLIHDACERSHVVNGQVGQHLAVNFDRCLFQAVGELAISQTALACGCIDTRNPQLTKHALFGAAVAVSILTRLHHRLFSDTEDITAATAETFG
jgi:hypothetical protein